ncbi:vesicle transport protein got1 [Quercus suber]|uniref:Vesicle transport protein got1 n=1 Tax=Quercus suber TaxID=58331 RepID=A0AAW0LUX1_QUESU
MVSFEMNDRKKIGLGLTGFGVFFSFLGIIFFFDKGLLAMGNWLLANIGSFLAKDTYSRLVDPTAIYQIGLDAIKLLNIIVDQMHQQISFNS